MIDERDVKYGDVFIWLRGTRRERKVMFVGWDDFFPESDEGRSWLGLDLIPANLSGKPASRRGLRAMAAGLSGWERAE